jgi:hypothetical protein
MNITHIVLRAKNDINGNPRRLSLLIKNGTVVNLFDHGYRGEPRGVDGWPCVSCEIAVMPSEYNAWKKSGCSGRVSQS